MKKVSLVVLIMLLVFSLAGCGGQASKEKEEEKVVPKQYSIVAGGAGSTWYLLMGATGELIQKVIPGATVAVEPGGAASNPEILNKGEAEFGICFTSTDYEARNGLGDYTQKHENLRSINVLMPYAFHILALEKANINEIEDLKGKKYTPAYPGQSSYVTAGQVLEVHGLNFEDTQVRPQGWTETHSAMQDLQLEAFSWWTVAGQPSFIDLGRNRDIKLIGFREDMRQKFLEKYPMYSAYAIPANSYDFQKEDIPTIGTYADFICNKDVPEEVVYTITKAMFENIDDLLLVHDALHFMTPENCMKELTIPLHPGAAKYYKEIGVEIPEKIAPVD